MAQLTFIVTETPNQKLATVGARLVLEEAAQLLELNARDLFTQAYLASTIAHCGFVLHVEHDPPPA